MNHMSRKSLDTSQKEAIKQSVIDAIKGNTEFSDLLMRSERKSLAERCARTLDCIHGGDYEISEWERLLRTDLTNAFELYVPENIRQEIRDAIIDTIKTNPLLTMFT